MAKRDGGNLNETNTMTTASADSHKDKVGLGSTGEPFLPDEKDHGFAPKGGFWDGSGKGSGSPVSLTERGAGEPGGHAAAEAALGAIGSKIKASHDQSGLLNVGKGDQGEKVEIPSESNLNSANKRVGA